MKLTIERVLIGVAVAVGIALSLAVSLNLVRTYKTETGSMEPTLPLGVRMLVVRARSVGRGDLVAFRYPVDPKVMYLKRVVGLPGEILEIRDKVVYINGRALAESYVVHKDPHLYRANPMMIEPYRSRDQLAPFRIAPDHYFVLGDNRDFSSDSRYFGTIARNSITGHVTCAFTLKRGCWTPR